MRIWVIGTTRNEVDLVGLNARYHLAQGVDRFLLLDNDSSDGTPDILEDLSREIPLEWAPCPGAFQQQHQLTRLAREAFERGAEWVLPVDADEFWHTSRGTLRQVLQASRAGSLRVEMMNFAQHRDQRESTPDALLGMTRRAAAPVGTIERAEDLVESERIAYVEHVYPCKWISRSSRSLRIDWGNHAVHGGPGPAVSAPEIVCLHAPLRSFAVLQSKVDAGRPSGELDDYFGIAWHLRRWRRLAWEDRLEDEWRANSYADDGTLDVHGVRRPVVFDDTLQSAVQPWLGA